MVETETNRFMFDDRNFGGREHWGADATNGVKQSISRDTDS